MGLCDIVFNTENLMQNNFVGLINFMSIIDK